MGSGSWTTQDFATYSHSTKMGYDYSSCRAIVGDEQLSRIDRLDSSLNPYKVVRECRDSTEHPNTVPVILALDVTGSMGLASIEVAAALGNIVDSIQNVIPDAEIMIMGIGDFAYDDAPLQVSQFESDIRIAEQLDLIYHEHGGGRNAYESYTAAWAFGVYNCKLDCLARGQKGIIITMGDEFINPYIDEMKYNSKVGANLSKDDLITRNLYSTASEKFDIFHINVTHGWHTSTDVNSWIEVLGNDNVFNSTVNDIEDIIIEIINKASSNSIPVVNDDNSVKVDENGAIGW